MAIVDGQIGETFGEIEASGEAAALTHPEWLALLLDQEASYRRDRRLHARLRYARLRHQAAVEDVDYRAACSGDRPPERCVPRIGR
jgi:DNA replication protein DnaC